MNLAQALNKHRLSPGSLLQIRGEDVIRYEILPVGTPIPMNPGSFTDVELVRFITKKEGRLYPTDQELEFLDTILSTVARIHPASSIWTEELHFIGADFTVEETFGTTLLKAVQAADTVVLDRQTVTDMQYFPLEGNDTISMETAEKLYNFPQDLKIEISQEGKAMVFHADEEYNFVFKKHRPMTRDDINS